MHIMIYDLRKSRLASGLSQVKLAHLSGVSLPTIQNMESGKSNPTLDILSKLLDALGQEMLIRSLPFDAERAAAFGVPLLSTVSFKTIQINSNHQNSLKKEIQKWLQCMLEKQLSERYYESVISFLTAIHDHYSDFYQQISNGTFDREIKKNRNNGKVIKLRRIALVNVSQYL